MSKFLRFNIDKQKFLSTLNGDGQAFSELVARCQPGIDALITRFGIQNKTVLSVGGGTCHEELSFIQDKYQNRLYCFDIDESNNLKPVLQRSQAESSQPSLFQYVIGDFTKISKQKDIPNNFDVLYMSSFTPDELRRRELMTKHDRQRHQPETMPWYARAQRWLYQMLGYTFLEPQWNETLKPLHPIIVKALSALSKHGIFILQSYCSGVDVTSNPSYLKTVIKQLKAHKMHLVEAYHLKEAPGVTLWIAVKSKKIDLLAISNALHRQNLLKAFHYRTELDNTAQCFYQVSPEMQQSVVANVNT